MRSGVCVLCVALAAALAAASARADAPATTAATTTEAAATTASTTEAAAQPLVPTLLPSADCPSAGAAAIVVPDHAPLAVAAAPLSLGPGEYDASGPAVAFESLDAAGTACSPGTIVIRSLSLFAGAVTADSVRATDGNGVVSNLRVDGNPVALAPGDSVAVGGWGLLVSSVRVGATLRAPLALRLLEARGPLPAGTELLVGYGTTSPPRQAPARKAAPPVRKGARPARHETTAKPVRKRHAHRRRKHPKHLPLKVTPPLGLHAYDFPVAGGADYADSYGGPRSDIRDGWHHGDDLFAPLGTPVLAVADGKLGLVGWQKLGGWRLWLRDARGNRFYYAHLAGYSRRVLHHRTVRKGQVIGFLGRTGDAFTTPPHLHFEIHPRRLLHLGYDGAVDPTRYLEQWRRATPAHVPPPAMLRAPKGEPRVEAAVVWHELLVARHLLSRARPAAARVPTILRRPLIAAASQAAASAPAHPAAAVGKRADTGSGPSRPWILAGTIALVLVSLLARRLRRPPTRAE